MLLTAAGGLAAAGLGTYLYAAFVEARRYRLESVNVLLDATGGGNEEQGNLRILHLSDLHLCKPESHKVEFLKRVTDDDYDLVVLTGDVFENYSGLEYADKILSRQPRLGAYAVLGNHDYYDYNMMHKVIGRIIRKFRHPSVMRDVVPIVDALHSSGWKVLRNESVTHSSDRLHIVGIDYPGISRDQLKALVTSAPENHAVLALQHVPRGLDRLGELGVHLAFAGHTHGGQIRVPGYGAIITDCELPRKDASGLIWRGDTAVHISRGVGADPRSNIRLFCPPHATILNVRLQ